LSSTNSTKAIWQILNNILCNFLHKKQLLGLQYGILTFYIPIFFKENLNFGWKKINFEIWKNGKSWFFEILKKEM